MGPPQVAYFPQLLKIISFFKPLAGGPGYADVSDYQRQFVDFTQKPSVLWNTFVEQAMGHLALFFMGKLDIEF